MKLFFNLGAIYYNLGNFEKSAEYFNKVNMFFTSNTEVEQLLTCALYMSGKIKAESKEFIENCPQKINLKEEIPLKIEYRYQLKNEENYVLNNIASLAIAYVREGNFKKALQKLFNGLKIWEECPRINYNIGIIYLNLNNLAEAEKYALIATKSSEFSISAKKKDKKYEKGNIDDIKEILPPEKWTFELALKHGNDFLEAYDLLGNIYFKKGEFEKSVKAFRKVIEIDPRDALGYYNLGCSYFGMKRYEEAERSWREAIKYDRRKGEKGEEVVEERGEMPRVSVTILKRTVSFHSYKSLGSLYKESGEIEKAIESYIRAIELFPADAECYYELGKLYLQKGDNENAKKNFEKYLQYGTGKENEVREIMKKLNEKRK